MPVLLRLLLLLLVQLTLPAALVIADVQRRTLYTRDLNISASSWLQWKRRSNRQFLRPSIIHLLSSFRTSLYDLITREKRQFL